VNRKIECKTCAAGGQHTFLHGTRNGYKYHGCDCEDCVAAMQEAERNRPKTCLICDAGQEHDFIHGRWGWEFHGCDCDICYEAAKDHWKHRPARCPICLAGEEHEFQHGTRKGYEWHGCPCELCRAAGRQRHRDIVERDGERKCKCLERYGDGEHRIRTHGYGAYLYHDCRCNICVAAAAERSKARVIDRQTDGGYGYSVTDRWYEKTIRDIPQPKRYQKWTPEEEAYILRDDIRMIDMAYHLKRSYQTIAAKRSQLLRGLPQGDGRRRKWTDAEDAMALRDDIDIMEICRILGRSYQSVAQRRLKLAS
jgi:hypothetical protein